MRSTPRSTRLVSLAGAAAVMAVGLVLLGVPSAAPAAAAVPAGFQDAAVLTGLSEPTAVQFAPDGRIFVAEKNGLIKVFHGLSDTAPTIFADLRTQVHNFWDRGLLGITLDPQFSTGRPYVYVLYTHDAALGGTAPRWGTADASSDGCPNPPGATAAGCVVSGHLSKLTANGDVMAGPEQVLVDGWCQQFPSHSMGTVAFGADGKLYASAGDGASFNYEDHGQTGNPCGDPAGEGGGLRAQSLRAGGTPTVLSGSVIRVDPDTGLGSSTNPLAGSADRNARRIVAEGLRNPFRFTIRPGTNEIWAGDVGWNTWEEINRVANPTAAVSNFGWPCYEGGSTQDAYSVEPMCKNLPASAVTAPYFTYNHATPAATGDNCATGSSSISGVAFHTAGAYPTAYNGALFFADYSRKCIWVMPQGSNGLPDPTQVRGFISAAAGPVSLTTGPAGDLYYTDLTGGTVHRVTYTSGNNPPVASLEASATNGQAPLHVTLSGSGSSDPDVGDPLTYSWDLNGDGVYGDATGVSAATTFTAPGNHVVAVRVTDGKGASSTARTSIAVGPGAPAVTINLPVTPTSWAAGDPINFLGSAIDPTDGVLPASALSWSATIEHCPSNCHTHPLQDFPGVASGSFTAPDHEYPSYVNLSMTATDSLGLSTTKTIRLDPATVDLTFQSQPSGLKLAVGGVTSTTPFTRRVIANSTSSVTALDPQSLAGEGYAFGSWSDAGTQGHDVTAGSTAQTLTATYSDTGPAAPAPALTISPGALAVSGSVGTSSAPSPVTLTNTGTADLHVSSFHVDDRHFTATAPGNCAVVAPGASCAISVTFAPSVTGAVSAELTVTDDDGGVAAGSTSQTVALTGTGSQPNPIIDRQTLLGGTTGFLGAPVGGQYAVPGGTAQNYVGGRIYYSPATGAHEVHGAILTHYLALGGPGGIMGMPTSDETAAAGAAGRFNTFTGGTMYWSLATGAHEVHGLILAHYLQLGGPAGLLRFPTSDETAVAGGRSNTFTGATMYWSGATGAHEVHGLILARYLALGGPAGFLRLPTSDETAVAGGRSNTFTGARVYWSGASGAHEVHGLILSSWLAQGAVTGRLGFPTSDEYAVTGGRRSDFQHGSVTWTPAKGIVTTIR